MRSTKRRVEIKERLFVGQVDDRNPRGQFYLFPSRDVVAAKTHIE